MKIYSLILLRFDNRLSHTSPELFFKAIILKGSLEIEANVQTQINFPILMNFIIHPFTLILIGSPIMVILLKKINKKLKGKILKNDYLTHKKYNYDHY